MVFSTEVVEYTRLIYGQSDGDIEVMRPFDQRLSRNFKLSEFHCKCNQSTCATTLVSRGLVQVLQTIRDAVNEPLLITSAYRCPSHNGQVGGSEYSQHTKGKAADFKTEDRSGLASLVPIISALPLVGALGQYFKGNKLSRLHVDVRPRGQFGIVEWREDI